MSGMRDAALPPRKRAVVAREREPQPAPAPLPPALPPRRAPPPMRCTHCGTTNTPLWRKGPAGPSSLCNACGTRWKRHGSTRLRRPISTSNREAVAVETKARRRESGERSPSPELPSDVPVSVAGPAAAARGRIRPRRTLCPECGGPAPERGAVCANCEALDGEQEVVEGDAPFEGVEYAQVGSSSTAANRLPLPPPLLASTLEGHPDLTPEVVAAYNRPPGPVPWEAPMDDDFFNGFDSPREEDEKFTPSSSSSRAFGASKKRSSAQSYPSPPAFKRPKFKDEDVEQRCISCGTTETPLWRRGPNGDKSLCNACGTRWKRYGQLQPVPVDDQGAYTPVARKRKPPTQRKLPGSPEPPKSPLHHSVPDVDSTLTPEEAARDIPYLPALHEAIPGGIEGISKEVRLQRSKRSRRRTPRGQKFFESLADPKVEDEAKPAPAVVDTSSHMDVDTDVVRQVDKPPNFVPNNLPEEHPSEGCTMN